LAILARAFLLFGPTTTIVQSLGVFSMTSTRLHAESRASGFGLSLLIETSVTRSGSSLTE
jgi:multisubunit Na+/H+ antiporter MnhG subunit